MGEWVGEILRTVRLAAISAAGKPKRRKGSLGGGAARAHNEAEAGRIARAGLASLGMPDAPFDLAGRGRWMLEKGAIAAVIRKRTGVSNRWIAGRLGMGHESSVTHAAKRAREDREDGSG